MSLLTLIVTLAVIGFLLWAMNAYIPMEPTIKRLINIVVIIAVILWLLNAFGLLDGLRSAHI